MNFLKFLFFSRFYHAVIGRVHGPSAEVIGDMDQFGILNWNVS